MRPRAIGLALLLCGCTPVLSPQITPLDRFVIEQTAPHLGGLSAITVLDAGRSFVAISDKGWVWTGQFARAADQITGISFDPPHRLADPTRDRKLEPYLFDAEGLAISRDGTGYISFESIEGRVDIYPDLTQPPTGSLRSPDFDRLAVNAGLESLAIGPDGTLYTLPERTGRAHWPYPVYRYTNDTWDIAFTIPKRDMFVATGADIGPDGRFYLLERDFTGFGFRSRVRRFDLDGSNERLLMQSRVGEYDNLEGISLWQNSAGEMIMTLISDDNFKFFQRSELVEFRIDG